MPSRHPSYFKVLVTTCHGCNLCPTAATRTHGRSSWSAPVDWREQGRHRRRSCLCKNGGLGFHMFHRITYLGGVGQVVDSCILYHFCIFNLESWGIMIQFHEHICQLGLKPSNFRRFWQAHHGYVLKWCLKNTSKSWGYPTPWELYSDAVSEIKRVPVDGMFYGSGIPGVGFQWVSSITRYLESL